MPKAIKIHFSYDSQPVCCMNSSKDTSSWSITTDVREVTCKLCKLSSIYKEYSKIFIQWLRNRYRGERRFSNV